MINHDMPRKWREEGRDAYGDAIARAAGLSILAANTSTGLGWQTLRKRDWRPSLPPEGHRRDRREPAGFVRRARAAFNNVMKSATTQVERELRKVAQRPDFKC
jgi:hypothetical protein